MAVLIIIIVASIAIAIVKGYQESKENNKKSGYIYNSNQTSGLNYTPLTKAEISPPTYNRGFVYASKASIYDETIEKLKKRYIAFDVETTGLSSSKDRIVELGAILFENEEPVKEFSTLVNPEMAISPEATAVNHITNEMISGAPTETKVYSDLVKFLGDALDDGTIMCAHNARFDMDFLSETLSRLGYKGHIYYVDTLSFSKELISGVKNYKQPTLAQYFDIVNEQEHRADSDAKVCGIILSKLLTLEVEKREKIAEEKRVQMLEEQLKKEEQQKIRDEILNKRNEVTISPINNRVPLSEIRNLNNSQKAFDDGYTYWQGAELRRKSGDVKEAIELFEKARYNGFCSPEFYESYAKAYRKLKDYDNEIDILDEGIERYKKYKYCEKLEERRYNAVCLLLKQKDKLTNKDKSTDKDNTVSTSKSNGRPVLQLSDDMTVIKRYETVTSASIETGINNKSIRDAARGIQKHAGGFVWKYADEVDIES